MIAVAAMAMVACADNEKINGEDGLAINFTEAINKSTKAEIANEQALAKAGGFKVWGYKNLISAGTTWTSKQTIFDGTTVSGTDAANPAWTYVGTKYWDKTCNYKFYAAGPATGMTGTLACVASGDADMKFTVTGAASALATASKSDFVIDRVVNKKDASTVVSGYLESFDFHHIMAKISFALKESDDLASGDVLIVKSMKMSGYNPNTGDFTQKKFDGTWAALNTSEWSQTSATNGKTSELIASDLTLTKTAQDLTGQEYIMVPQVIAANGLKFTLDYTLNNEEFKDQVATLTEVQTWGTDSHTKYTITVGPLAIKFDVTSVCDFCFDAPGKDVSVQ